jgi:hypothetical protein
MKSRLLPVTIITGIIVVLGIIGIVAWPRIIRMLTRSHQQNVTLELKQLGKEFSNITNREEALRSAEMIEYVIKYYPVGPGYRSDPQTEQNLEKQRIITLNAIQNGLRQFTKQDGDNDPNKWKEIIRNMPAP